MRKLFVAGIVALFAIMIASPAAFAQHHDNGTISGIVADQSTNLPIAYAMVQALGPNHYPAMAMTGNDGHYQIHLPYGSYKIVAGKMGYGLEWWQETADSALATVVVIAESSNAENINFTLTPPPPPPSGTISGIVTTDDTIPHAIGGAMVRAEGSGMSMMAHSDSLGHYSITLPYGDYFVHAEARDFHAEWWQEVAERSHATAVHVADGQNPAGINFTLTPYGPPPPPPQHGSIAGLITNAGDSQPLAHASVMVMTSGMHPMTRMVFSGDDGTYLVDNLPSGYYLVNAHKDGFIPNHYADSVHVDSVAVTGINIALSPLITGSIVGVITDGITNLPIRRAMVMAADISQPRSHMMAMTDSTGAYILEVPVGSYHVEAQAEGYYHAVIDSPVVVGDFAPVTVNFALMPIAFGSISGNVYDTLNAPIRHAWVEARIVNGHGRMNVRTDSTGYYIFEHAIPGNYILTANANRYQPAVYPETVVVANGQVVTGINFHLAGYAVPTGTIAGNVISDSTGLPIGGAMVIAFGIGQPGHNRFNVKFTRTDSTGAYLFERLQATPYKVMCFARGYIGEFYNNKTNWNDADQVTPNASGINFGLATHTGGPRYLAGQIIENNEPVAGAIIVVMDNGQISDITSTYPDGSYEFANVEPGSYTVQALTSDNAEASVAVNVIFSDIDAANIVLVATGINDNVNLPTSTSLEQNYPNPFNSSTNIKFNLVKQSEINLTVYDLLGRKVAMLANGTMPVGEMTINWNGIDDKGAHVASGMYLYVLKVDGASQSKHMMLLK